MPQPDATPTSSESPVQRICLLDELPQGTVRSFELLRKKKSGRAIKWSIFVVRAAEQDALFGYVNKCPHQPVPLDWEGNPILDPSAMQLQCGKHGARFTLDDGQCVHGPCLGESLQSVALQVRDGAVYVHGVELVAPEQCASGAVT